jgi:hypothetical protein
LSAVLRDAGGAELAASSSVRIGSDRLVITGRYEARPDGPDELGRFASLAIDIGLSALAPGPCAVSLKVVEPDTGAAIAPGGATCSAPTGAFTATVRIDGLLLRGRTAPWRIADVMVEDLTAHGAVLADMDQHGFLTRALDAGLFGPPWRALVPAALVPVRVARE